MAEITLLLGSWVYLAPVAVGFAAPPTGAAEIYCPLTGGALVLRLEVIPPLRPGEGAIPPVVTFPISSISSVSYSFKLLFQTITTESIPAEQK